MTGFSVRRVSAVGVLTIAALVFALRFQPPPSGLLDDDVPVAATPVPTTTSLPPQATTPHVRPTMPPVTVATFGPGVQIVAGPAVQMNRGYVQVEVKVIDGLLADVQMIVTPSESRRAREISIAAAREMRLEAIERQTYRIHTVSGATETSIAYRQSLKAALLDAGFIIGPA